MVLVKKSDIKVNIKQILGSLFDSKLYSYKETAISVAWIIEKNKHFYVYRVHLKDIFPLQEGAGTTINISFRELLSDDDLDSSLSVARSKDYIAPKHIRKVMLEDYIENYTESLREAGIKNFRVSGLKKFALLTQRNKTDISFETIDQLKERLYDIGADSLKQFLHFSKL